MRWLRLCLFQILLLHLFHYLSWSVEKNFIIFSKIDHLGALQKTNLISIVQQWSVVLRLPLLRHNKPDVLPTIFCFVFVIHVSQSTGQVIIIPILTIPPVINWKSGTWLMMPEGQVDEGLRIIYTFQRKTIIWVFTHRVRIWNTYPYYVIYCYNACKYNSSGDTEAVAPLFFCLL